VDGGQGLAGFITVGGEGFLAIGVSTGGEGSLKTMTGLAGIMGFGVGW